MNLSIPQNETDISKHYASINDFISSAVKRNGKVLVLEDDTGEGAALIIAFMMNNAQMQFFQAHQQIVKKRYIVTLKSTYMEQLLKLEKEVHQTEKLEYECICKNVSYTILQPPDRTEKAPLPCDCKIEDTMYSPCPNIGCNDVIIRMEALHNYNLQSIRWSFTTKNNIQGNFQDCDEYSPLAQIPFEERQGLEEKDWIVHRCRICEMVVYATSKVKDSSVAVVTNTRKERNSPQ